MADADVSPDLSFIAGSSGIRIAQKIFGLAVIPVGLGHIFYADITASLIPAWMPFRVGLAYLTGIGQIACGLGFLEAKLLADYVRATLDDGAGSVPRIPPYDAGRGLTRMGKVFA